MKITFENDLFLANHYTCTGITCYNGGTCSVSNGMPACACANGYTGANCESSKSWTINFQ